MRIRRVCVALSAASQTAMVVVMSPLALAMDADGFSKTLATRTYQIHFASMYAPGLLTSRLIGQMGEPAVAAVGSVALGAAALVLLFFGGHSSREVRINCFHTARCAGGRRISAGVEQRDHRERAKKMHSRAHDGEHENTHAYISHRRNFCESS